MSKQQFGLGKGLGALIPEPEPVPIVDEGNEASPGAHEQGGILRLPLGRIEPNPEQPRKTFSDESIAELADSIKRHGLIQPILVENVEGGRYRIVAGERRWRAASVAGLREIPVIVQSFSPERRFEIALIENVQREDLNPVEEAEAYKALMELTACTQEEVADKVGKSRPAVANALRLLRLPSPALDALKNGRISAGHARALLSVQDSNSRDVLLSRLIDEGLSVRQAEAAAQELNRGAKNGTARIVSGGSKPPEKREVEIVELEQRLIGVFGTKVAVKGDGRKGSIIIDYYSLEDLERIIDVVAIAEK
jgi:ParB family transcriptional regulator, chromosome partitioning protein